MADATSQKVTESWYRKLLALVRRIEWATVLLIAATLALLVATLSLFSATDKLTNATIKAEEVKFKERNSNPVVDASVSRAEGTWSVSIRNTATFPVLVRTKCDRIGDVAANEDLSDAFEMLIPAGVVQKFDTAYCRPSPDGGKIVPVKVVLRYVFRSVLDDDRPWPPMKEVSWRATRDGLVDPKPFDERIAHDSFETIGNKAIVNLPGRVVTSI